jgi:hypothetical protein
LRLWFSTLGYLLVNQVRRVGLRRVSVSLSAAWPRAALLELAAARLSGSG